ncbi:glycosyltransferase family 4 protein [Companilactobacillus jidongensis]|uniref:glycosyltransferase family 4 protein n=1 Tax=Companilactobacillus jidongensis TaxID=2486006 RepID=UPI0013DE09EC|nr:glycosyltransferase family 4 protein [Companilactobacillus jidongensis]
MIVLHFAEYASGGVATYLKNLIMSQISLKEVDKVYLLVSDYKTDEELLNIKSKKIEILTYQYRRNIKGIVTLIKLSKKIKELNPDIIHIHSTIAGLIRIKFIFSALCQIVLMNNF